jgi:hypothetical protein
MPLHPASTTTIALAILAGLAACSRSGGNATAGPGNAQAGAAGPGHTAEQDRDLANFDDLDFRVYSNQRWDELSKSHAPDILVHYPDGSTTTGLADHIARLKPQFVFAPDTRIREHPIKLADANFTAVEGFMTGTFSRPMDLGGGKTIQPTGKKFNLAMVTIGRWENGVMKEEWLFWDNAAFMKQVGVGQ